MSCEKRTSVTFPRAAYGENPRALQGALEGYCVDARRAGSEKAQILAVGDKTLTAGRDRHSGWCAMPRRQ
jgi:hypothetical protein